MAQAEKTAVVKVKVEPDLTGLKDSVGRSIYAIDVPEPKMPERPASELRLESLRLAVKVHETFCLDEGVARTAKTFADFVVDGTAAGA